MKILSVEGLVGAGKTTLLQKIKPLLPPSVEIIYEPVERFQTYKQFNPLKLFYDDPVRNAGFVQYHIIEELGKHFSEKISDCEKQNTKLMICERNMFSPRIFINLLLKRNYLTMFEYEKLLEKVDTTLQCVLPKDCSLGAHYIFFINTPVHLCRKRIALRARDGEVNNISEEYLADMRQEYFSYIHMFKAENGQNTMRVEENDDLDDNTLSRLVHFTQEIITE